MQQDQIVVATLSDFHRLERGTAVNEEQQQSLSDLGAFTRRRLRRWPLWDPDAGWEALRTGEKPLTRWAAFWWGGLRGLRWLRRDRFTERVMGGQLIGMQLESRRRLERQAWREANGIVEEERPPRPPPMTAREAIESQLRLRPYGSVFWTKDLTKLAKCDEPYVAEVVKEIAAQPDSGLEEYAPGFWCNGLPPSRMETDGPMILSSLYVGLRYAGAGGGIAGMHALNRLGWTTQMTARCRIAVMAGTPPPFWGHMVHEERHNRGRLSLTWAEVTLLEGLQTLIMAEKSDQEIREELASGQTCRNLRRSVHIERDKVMTALRDESTDSVMLERQESILEAMPQVLSSASFEYLYYQPKYWQQVP